MREELAMQENIIVFPEPPPGDKAQLVTHTLPVQLTQLVGREQEVQAIQASLLRPEVRLLTLSGTAGVGKTRLALEVAQELVHDFADGVHVVSLAPLSDPDLVIPAIAHGLGLMESGSQPILELLKVSQHDKHRLLLLDNFEQVITAAPLLAELLEGCSQLKLLVTSREVLRLRGEHQFAVPPLSLPNLKHLPDAQSLAHVPAVHLFLQRAQALQADFQLTTDNAATIAEICLRLDGLPLAIELAAARIKLLTPQALLTRLDRRLHVLTGGARDLPERQRTLRNTLAWSYELLTSYEQLLFRRLSIFVGGCTLEEIEAVCAALDDEADHVLEGVASLLDKSLLHQTEQKGAEPRLVMLETIREYALEASASSGEIEDTRRAHAAYYLRLGEEAEPELVGPLQTVWVQRLERAHENLRAALQWLLEQAEGGGDRSSREMALRLSAALWLFWDVRGHASEGRTFLERALVLSEGTVTTHRLKALKGAANMAVYYDDTERGDALCKEILTLSRELGDRDGVAHTLYLRGIIAGRRNDLAAACTLLEEALALWRELDVKDRMAWALFFLSWQVRQQGNYARARVLCEESLTLHREKGNTRGIAYTLSELAVILLVTQGDLATGRALLEESLALARELGDRINMARCFSLLGEASLQQGALTTARSLAEQSLGLSKETGDQDLTALGLLGKVHFVQGDYTAARALYEENLTVPGRVDAPSLEGLANVVAAQGEPRWAAQLWGAAEALRESQGLPIPPFIRSAYERSVAAARAQLGEKAFAAAWEEGRTMTAEQALAAQGRTSVPTAPPIPPAARSAPLAKCLAIYPAGLTPREMEVLRLLAQGLTSAQIAERLVIGLVTVNSHVRSIYSKLGVTSRAAATRYALEHQLL
jgi:predicted ATPase/DNA-binding CsgD family transcriptional regulator